MKKSVKTIFSVLALSSLLVAGCSGGNQPAPSNTSSTEGAGQEEKIEGKLVIAGNGATVEKLMKDKIFKKFNEKYPDVELAYVAGVATEIVAKVKAQKNSPQIDVTYIEGGEQEKGRVEGLWQPITEKDVPSISKISKELAVSENSGAVINFTPMGISYNSELVKEKGLPIPSSWNDLTKPEMKGNLTMNDVTSNFGRSALIMLSYANGGSEKDVEEGFKHFGTIAGYMPTFAKSAAQLQQNLQSKSAVYTTWPMARSITQKKAGLPLEFVVPKEGANIIPTVGSVVKDAKNPEAAKAFIEFLLTDEIQTLFATEAYYVPAVDVPLPEEVKKELEFDRSKIVYFDYGILSKESGKWIERFNKEIAPKVGK
ncbi:extracellular solute-binding protein [Brevibacillus daliensis]|uniref:extracellular solute-binding protein n=1 Tax=Brevibacillus daliensis TaxID=2892995 RepID=UPI001E5BD8D0|nr:extracellular solute-binding protein [Brevibacillus daliensis]